MCSRDNWSLPVPVHCNVFQPKLYVLDLAIQDGQAVLLQS